MAKFEISVSKLAAIFYFETQIGVTAANGNIKAKLGVANYGSAKKASIVRGGRA